METTTVRPLTSRTRVALAIARGMAAARGDTDLTAAHIVIGILRERRNFGVAALADLGLQERGIDTLSSEFEHSLPGKRGRVAARDVAIDLTPGETEILAAAEREANDLNDEYLGTEHILLALLRADHAIAQRFGERGITLERYYNALLSIRRGDPPPHMPHHV